MNKYLVVPFYLGSDPSKGDEVETRIVGCRPRKPKDPLDMRLVSRDWQLGYPIDAVDHQGIMAELRFTYRPPSHELKGLMFTPTSGSFMYVQPPPPICDVQFHDIKAMYGDRKVVVVTTSTGLSVKGTKTLINDGFYHEDTASRILREDPKGVELVKNVFDGMRVLGYRSTAELLALANNITITH